MASLDHLLPSLLLLGFIYTSITGHSIQSPIARACPSFDCGNGITIGYPFWHQSQQFEHCGYPGFNLSCNDQNPTLHLFDDIYHVKNINYSSKSLTLVHTEIKEENCPKILPHGIMPNTTPSLFNYTLGNKMLRFFYNCTLYPPSLPHVACLLYGAKRSYVFVEGAIPEFDWHRYCETIASVPVSDEAFGGDLVQNFGKILQHGFKLSWQQPDGPCQSCEATGGFCGYNNDLHKNFFCICSDEKHSINVCYDHKGAVSSVGLEPNYAAIGALTFGGLVTAATVFYFIQKKKVSSYKPV